MAFSVSYIYEILNRYSGPLSKIKRDTDRFKKSVAQANSKISLMNKRLKESEFHKFGKSLNETGKQLTTRITLPLAALGIMAGKTAVDMQSGFIGVRKTVTASAEQLAKMRGEFEQMSTEIPVSVGELYKIGEAAGQLGIETKSITSFTKTMAMLGATTNIAGEEGAMELSRFANITKMSQGDFDRLGSTIVHLGNNLATTEAEISGMALRLAGAGKFVGMSEHQILSLAAAARSIGLEAEAGGTAFSRVMKMMNNAVDKGGSKFRLFAKITGQSTKEFAKKFKTDAAGSIVDFVEGLQRMKKEGANITGTLEKLKMADIRISDALLRAAGSGDIFRKAMGLGALAWEENNALTKEAELRFGSWGSKLTIAWNKLKLVSNEIGKVLIPMFIKLVDFVMPILESFNGLSRTSKIIIIAIGLVAAAIPPLLSVLGLVAMAMASIKIAFGVGAIASIGAMAVPFLAVAAAVGAVSAAVYQLTSKWDTLSAPGFWKDLAGWGKELLGFDKIGQPMPGNKPWQGTTSDIGQGVANEKAQTRAAINNKMEAGGEIRVSAAPGSQVESASINLNQGYNLAVAH